MPEFCYYLLAALSLLAFIYILRYGASPKAQYENEPLYLRQVCAYLIPLGIISFPLWLLADNTPYATPTFLLFLITTPLAIIHLCIRVFLILKNNDNLEE